MPASLSNVPAGLLSLLGIQSQGENVRELADQIVGTLDLSSQYFVNRYEYAAGTVAAAAVGSNNLTAVAGAMTVPAGELWRVHLLHGNCSPGAGAAIDYAPGIAYGGVGVTPVGPYVAGAANQNARFGRIDGFWMPPGAAFAVLVRSQTLAPSIDVGFTFTRLRV